MKGEKPLTVRKKAIYEVNGSIRFFQTFAVLYEKNRD